MSVLQCKKVDPVNSNFVQIVQKTEDGRYVILQPDGRSIPLKVTSVKNETPEPKKYIVKSKFGIFLFDSCSNLTNVSF